MSLWAPPPIAKVYEALTAIADGRVRLLTDTSAEVTSSSGHKLYSVTWSTTRDAFSSNDNGSYWRGYLGYPIIAVLLMLGEVDYDSTIAASLHGIPWKQVNDRHKGDYDAAVAETLDFVARSGIDPSRVVAEVVRIHEALRERSLVRQRSGPPPAE